MSAMNYEEFLAKVINRGIEAAKRDYHKERDKEKREGSIEGFGMCRKKTPAELQTLLDSARRETMSARMVESDSDHGKVGRLNVGEDYWRVRCREAEIEWVCNVVSAMLVNEKKSPIIPPTARGTITAGKILEGAL